MAIVVIIPAFAHRLAVQNDAEQARVRLLQQVARFDRRLPLRLSARNDENGAVAKAREDLCVRHSEYRRAVEKNDVETVINVIQKLAHRLGAEQLCRIRGDRPARNDVKVIDVALAHDFRQSSLLRQQVGQTERIVQSESIVNGRLAHVRIDQKHAFSLLSHDNGEVRGRHRLAFGRAGRRDDKGFQFPVSQGKLDVRPDRPVLFRDRRFRIQVRNQAALFGAV